MQAATSLPSVHRNTQRCGRGREADSETGLQYNRARYYDPKVGRWLSQDPLGFAAGDGNLYRYVGNAPTRSGDPSRLDPDLSKLSRTSRFHFRA